MTDADEEKLAESSLLTHLLELRDRILRSLVATLVIALPCLWFANEIFTWISAPLRAQLPEGARLIATSVVAPFMTPFKLALLAAFFFAMPVILYQVWAFVAPGLYKRERRFALPLFVSSVILFYAGAAFAYFVVFPVIFNFFVMTTPEGVEMMTDITQYMDFAVLLFFAFGLAFEIPVATVLLVRTGLVKRETLAKNRGYVLLAIFIIAAFLTPPDPISQTLMALPMYALYEAGLLMSRLLVPASPRMRRKIRLDVAPRNGGDSPDFDEGDACMSQDLNIPQGTFLGHPKGLYLLFATEMWERFSFYGMRALLVLYAAAATHAVNPGLGWAEPQALKLYGWYLGLVYGTAIFGGWIADNWLGQRKAVILGGVVMAAGQFMLAAPLDILGTSGAFSSALGIAFPDTPTSFYLGLVLMCVGNGFFKPNISTMVGDLYAQGDSRRDGAFVIFYMGINVGAFLAPLVCSTLGEDPAYGWRAGFFAAGVGMLLSVIIQLAFAQRYIGNVGREPAAKRSLRMAGGEKKPLTQVERERLRVIFVIFTFVVIFWATFEQAGGLMNLFAEKYARREVGGFLVPTGWFQSLNPLFIVLLGIPFSMLWTRLGASGRNPPTPVKMYLGLAQVALGFICLVIAVFEMQRSGDMKSGMIWLVLAYFFHTTGELCISPVGLSMITKLAPLRLGSLMMGVWFLVNLFGNTLAGYIGAFTENMGEYAWMVDIASDAGVRPEHAGLLGVFGGLAVVLLLFSVILWAISGRIVTWMHGAEEVRK